MNEEPQDWEAQAEREYDEFTEALWRELHPEPAQPDNSGAGHEGR